MSDREHDCRWTIAHAYLVWCVHHGPSPYNWLAYIRALGLEPTDRPWAEGRPGG